MNDNEHKPCPKCGGELRAKMFYATRRYYIECDDCDYEWPGVGDFEFEEKAWAAWDKRSA